MSELDGETWQALADCYAFIGNSLLKPMNQTSDIGLSPAFWEAFPDFGDKDVASAVARCTDFAKGMHEKYSADKAVERVAVEFTKLFIGPPKPAAAPWQTFYRAEGVHVGFGQATFQMHNILASAGLELHNENNQYEDHMGVELLYLSVLCKRIAEGESSEQPSEHGEDADKADAAAPTSSIPTPEDIESFVTEYPLAWVGTFRGRIHDAVPGGYYDNLVSLEEALLNLSF